MKTRLRNYTDIPTSLIRTMLAFCQPSNVTGIDVRISNLGGNGYRGRAYPEGSACHDRACPFIIVSVQRGSRVKPRAAHGGYLPRPPMTREEAVLFVLAHELRHLWQAKVRRGRRVWGSRGVYSERDADAYGLRALRHWRRGEAMP